MRKFELYLESIPSTLSVLSESVYKARYRLYPDAQRLFFFFLSYVSLGEDGSVEDILIDLEEIYALLKQEKEEDLESLKDKLKISLSEIHRNHLILSLKDPEKGCVSYPWFSKVEYKEDKKLFI